MFSEFKMMKTRRGMKRAASKESEDKQQSTGKKKSKTGSPSTSKYFEKEGIQEDEKPPKNEQSLCIDTVKSVVYKSEEVSRMKYESDSDGSSSDEFMKAPFSLDELGKFESLKKDIVKEENNEKPCSLDSCDLLEEDSGDEKETNKQQYYDFSQIMKSQQLLIDTKIGQQEKMLGQNQVLGSNCSKKRAVKKSISLKRQNIGSANPGNEELGVSELLYITEGPNLKRNQNDCSNLRVSSDNDEINLEETYSVPKEGVQVTIELPNSKQKIKSKGFDIEAAMKRRINLIKKENQIFMHKVHVLCWVAHCLHLNRTINNDDLLGIALSLIPSKHCYPPKHADLSYLEKLVDWFVTKVIVDKDHKHALNSSNLPLLDILETAINIKTAFSLRDLVLIFVCMVRSLGINARLVVSLRPVPLRPPVTELCQVNSNSNATNSNSCHTPNKQVHVTKTKKPLKLTKEGQNNSLATSKSHSDKKCSSHYFDKPMEPAKLTAKQKGVRKSDATKKQNGSLQSPYFSSSDELPLNKLICQRSHKEVTPTKCQETIPAKNNSPKPRNVTKTSLRQSNSALEVKKSLTDTENSSFMPGKTTRKSSSKASCKEPPSLNSEKKTTSKSDPKSTTGQKQQKTAKNDEKLMIKETRSRRPNSKLCLEPFFDSTDEEVEFVEITPKRKIKAIANPKSSDFTKKKIVSCKPKGVDSDVDFELSKPSTSKKKSLDRRVLSSDEDSSSSRKIGNDFWVEVFLEAEEKWISVDLKKKKVHCIQQLYVSIIIGLF